MMANMMRNFMVLMVAGLVSAQQQMMTLMDVLNANNSTLSTLNSLLQAQPAILSLLSSSPTPLTILAPSNDAFQKLLSTPSGMKLSQDPGKVAALLEYHVLNGSFASTALTENMQFVSTLLVNETYTNVTGGQVVGVQKMNMGKGGNDGMKVMVLSGEGGMSGVTMADVMYDHGIIHILDTPLTIPLPPSTTALDSQLTSLTGALKSTNLSMAVDGLKDITLFVPSNQAFQNIGSALPALSNTDLTRILGYHVINGTVGYSSLLTTGLAIETFPTLAGERVGVEVFNMSMSMGGMMGMGGMRVFVDSAMVVKTDILVSNGVVHVIDKTVLNPAAATLTPNPAMTTQPVAYSGALSVATVPFTSGVTATTTAPSASKTAGAGKVYGSVGVAALFGVGGMGVLQAVL